MTYDFSDEKCNVCGGNGGGHTLSCPTLGIIDEEGTIDMVIPKEIPHVEILDEGKGV